jgi:hypothetical protein
MEKAMKRNIFLTIVGVTMASGCGGQPDPELSDPAAAQSLASAVATPTCSKAWIVDHSTGLKTLASLLRRETVMRLPSGLPAVQVDQWKSFVGWANDWVDHLSELAQKADSLVQSSGANATVLGRELRSACVDMQAAINDLAIQNQERFDFVSNYVYLQEKMQNTNTQYTTISNVLKTKHDTIKNSINNVR